MAKKIFISVLAVIAGILLITIITESLEILVISLSSDKPLTELMKNQSEYFTIRNQPLNNCLKIFYNAFAAFVGGYVCAIISKQQPMKLCLVLVIIQTLGFVYGMTLSEYAKTTPLWLWFLLILVSAIGITFAGYLKIKRNALVKRPLIDDKVNG